MKKKRMLTKAASVVLALALTVGLAACGTNTQKEESADSSLAKQYVFTSQDLDFEMNADDMSMRGIQKLGDRIYMLVELYDYTKYSDVNTVKLLSMNMDGSDIQEKELQIPGADSETDAETESSEESSDVVQPRVEAETMELDEDFGVDENFGVDDGYYEESTTYEYTSYGNYCLTENGYVYGIKNETYSDWSDPDNYINTNTYSLCSWDMEGQFLWEKPIEHLHAESDETYLYVQQMTALDDGTLAILVGGDAYYKMEADAEGNVSAMQDLPALAEKVNNINQMFPKTNGEFIVTYYDDSWTKLYMATYDIKTDTLGEATQLPESITWSGYSAMTTGISTDIVYATSSGVFGLNVGDAEPKQIMSFINSDLSTTYLNTIFMLDDEHFVAFYGDNLDNGRTKGAFFTRKNPEDIPDKSVLVMAGNYIGSDVRNRVVEFNKTSEQYRIVLKEYESMATSEDYMAGYAQLNNDIISGNMPDILVYDGNLPVENYISKGLLADVGELIAKDEELSKVEYLQNVFDAYKVNEKLYHIISSFYVRTVIGKESLLGGRESWSFDELKEVLATMPEGTQAFGEMTRTSFLNTLMQYCGSDFVDASTGKCNFDSPDFIAMLEFANTLPEEINYDYDDPDYWDNYWKNSQSQYREGRTLLMECYIGSVRDMNYSINGYFGADVTYVGFPTENGKGSVLGANNNCFVLSAKSANLDGAWEFVRYYLTEDYQKTLDWGMPTIKSIFMEKAEEAMEKPYYLDENGDKVEYDENFELDGETIPLEPMSKEQKDQLVEFIQTVDSVMYYNEDIQNIVEEETASYFAGQKSVNEVVQIIQSRAQIYVDENR